VILVDTSVWIDHLRKGDKRLAALLREDATLCHSFVIGELACGQLNDRAEILSLLSALPRVPKASDDELLAFLDENQLMGRGLGLVDVHLLASSCLAGVELWTRDKRLRAAAEDIGAAWADAP
jgi:hypothetical protein